MSHLKTLLYLNKCFLSIIQTIFTFEILFFPQRPFIRNSQCCKPFFDVSENIYKNLSLPGLRVRIPEGSLKVQDGMDYQTLMCEILVTYLDRC